MEIRVNGAQMDTDAQTVAALLDSLEIPAAQKGIAVALNENVVPRRQWEEAELHAGDAVEIIRAAQGG